MKSATFRPDAPSPVFHRSPDGAKYYQFQIHHETTTNLTADQIHQIGLEEVKKDEAAMLEIAKKLGFEDLKSFRESIKTNPKLHPASPEALLAAYQGHVDDMRGKLPQLFRPSPQKQARSGAHA